MTCLNWKSEARLRLSTRYHLGNGKPAERHLRGKNGALECGSLQIPAKAPFFVSRKNKNREYFSGTLASDVLFLIWPAYLTLNLNLALAGLRQEVHVCNAQMHFMTPGAPQPS